MPDQKPPNAVKDNIRSVTAMETSLEEKRSLVDRIADLIGGFSGSMTFVGIHVLWFVLWFLINTGVIAVVRRFDPYPFILLAMIVSVEGVLLSTFVLMKQNRMQKRIDILSEKEVTKALQLLQAICAKLDIEVWSDSELEEMASTTSIDLIAQQVQTELPECK